MATGLGTAGRLARREGFDTTGAMPFAFRADRPGRGHAA